MLEKAVEKREFCVTQRENPGESRTATLDKAISASGSAERFTLGARP